MGLGDDDIFLEEEEGGGGGGGGGGGLADESEELLAQDAVLQQLVGAMKQAVQQGEEALAQAQCLAAADA